MNMSTPQQPEQKKEYKSEWREYEDYSLSGNWFYRVGIIWDGQVEKVRVAKCLKKPSNPMTQVQKINYKTMREYEAVDVLTRKFLAKLEGSKQ